VSLPSVTATATATATAAPAPVLALPPIPVDARPACDIAAEARSGAEQQLAQGRAYKALRAIEAADRRCPSSAQTSWRARLEALSALGKDEAARALAAQIAASASADPAAVTAAKALLAKTPAPPSGSADALLASAIAAHQSKAKDARAQLDRALARLEIETGKTPIAFLDVQERKPLALSGDGKTAVLAQDKLAIVADAKTLAPRRFLEAGSTVDDAVLSADGTLVATVDQGGGATVWSVATGARVRSLTWAGEDANAAAFTSDGKRLVLAGANERWNASARVFDLSTGNSLDSIATEHTSASSAVALSRDDKLLAFGSTSGHLEIWSLSPRKRIGATSGKDKKDKKDSYGDGILALAFSPKGDRLASLDRSGAVTVWDTKQGKALWKSGGDLRVDGAAIAFSADGSRVRGGAEGGYQPSLREWDAATGTALQNRPVDVAITAFSQDGSAALGATRDAVGVVDVASGTTTIAPVSHASFGTVQFAPPRLLVVAPDHRGALLVISPKGARRIATADHEGAFAVSLDGSTLARAAYREVSLWSLDAEAPPRSLGAPPDSVSSLSFDVSGAVRALVAHTDKVTLLSATAAEPSWKKVASAEPKNVRSALMSAYGRSGAVVTDKEVLVLDAVTGQLTTADEDDKERVQDYALSGDGKVLFVVRDRRVTRHDALTGKASSVPAAMGCYSSELIASFDGSRLLSGCSDGAELFTFTAENAAPQREDFRLEKVSFQGVALAPQGDLMATVDDDGSVRIWDTRGAERGAVRTLAGADAALVMGRDGRVLLAGKDASKLEERLFCRVGAYAVPFAVCADVVTDDRLLEEVLAPLAP
jgi:WD40 repeat protein